MKKLFKTLFIFTIIFVFPFSSVFAEDKRVEYNTASISMSNYTNGRLKFYVAENKALSPDIRGRFFVHQIKDGNNYYHTYSLDISNSNDASSCNSLLEKNLSIDLFDLDENKNKKYELLLNLLSNAYYFESNSSISSGSGIFYPSNNGIISTEINSKIIATQILVWEVVEGGRTSFDSYEPNYNPSNSAYSLLINAKGNNELKNAYTNIIDRVKQNASTSNTVFASSSTYILPSNGDVFTKQIGYAGNYQSCETTDANVSATVSNKMLTITSNKELVNEVTVNCKSVSGTTSKNDNKYYKFTCGENRGFPNLIRARLSSEEVASLKVRTSKQNIKVAMVDENDEELTGAVFTLKKMYDQNNYSMTFDLRSNSSEEKVLNQDGYYILEETTVPKDREPISPTTLYINTVTGVVRVEYGAGVTITSGDTVTIKVKNEIKAADLTINALGRAGARLEGVGFYLLSEGKSKIKLYEVDAANGIYSNLQGTGSQTENYITNKKGQIILKDIMPGVYYLQEYSMGNTGYPLPEGEDAIFKIEIESTKKGIIVNKSSSHNIMISNVKNEFSFYKVDENGNFLSGGLFKIQKYNKKKEKYQDVGITKVNKQEYDSEAYKIDDKSDTFIFSINDGIATFVEIESGSKYRIVEIDAPEGYTLSTQASDRQLVIDVDSSGYVKGNTTMVNKKINVDGEVEAKAELILNIQTGQNRIKYAFIISIILIIIVALLIYRKKENK